MLQIYLRQLASAENTKQERKSAVPDQSLGDALSQAF